MAQAVRPLRLLAEAVDEEGTQRTLRMRRGHSAQRTLVMTLASCGLVIDAESRMPARVETGCVSL